MSTGIATDPDVAKAARAVAYALRPSHRDLLEQHHGDAAPAIETAMREDWHTERTVSFWQATGPGLTASLMHVTDADETTASFIIGASLHATILARQDTAPDSILRLAERAACWEAGRRWVTDRIT